MMKRYNSATTAIALAMLMVLSGCSGEAEEAKKLGFASVEEMKEIQAKGWHTKARYDEDTAKTLGYSSVSEMKAVQENHKLVAKSKDTTSESPAVQVASKWDNDDFVECKVVAMKTLEALKSSGKASARNIEDSENANRLLDRVFNIKEQGGQLTKQQFETKFHMLANQIPTGGIARNGRTTDWYESCIQNSLTVSQVFNNQLSPSEAKIKNIPLPSSTRSNTTDSPEQLASKIPPMDAARCGIVFASYGAIMINSNQVDEGLAGMRFAQATQYVVDQAVSRGEPAQLYENAQNAYNKEMRVTPPNNIVNEATACVQVFRPLFLALDARGYIKR
jgi:hypothetical protein